MHIETITLQIKHDQCTEMYWGIEEETGHCINQNYYVTKTLNVP